MVVESVSSLQQYHRRWVGRFRVSMHWEMRVSDAQHRNVRMHGRVNSEGPALVTGAREEKGDGVPGRVSSAMGGVGVCHGVTSQNTQKGTR